MNGRLKGQIEGPGSRAAGVRCRSGRKGGGGGGGGIPAGWERVRGSSSAPRVRLVWVPLAGRTAGGQGWQAAQAGRRRRSRAPARPRRGGQRQRRAGPPPVREEDAAFEEGVRRPARQPLYPLHQRRVYVLASKLRSQQAGRRAKQLGRTLPPSMQPAHSGRRLCLWSNS